MNKKIMGFSTVDEEEMFCLLFILLSFLISYYIFIYNTITSANVIMYGLFII